MFAFPVMLIAAPPAAFATDYSTNWLTFAVHKSRYVTDAQEAAKAGKDFRLWDWGGNVMIGVNRFLLWDAQDEVAPVKGQWTQPRRDLPVTEYRVIQKLGPHFYLIEQ
jgi:hypothetical protein